MNIRNLAFKAAAVVAVAIVGSIQAFAWTENFDSYATNSTIIGQGGWQGWDQNPLADSTVVDTVSVSTPNSLRITGTSDSVHTYSGYTTGKYIYRTMQYVSSTSVGDAYFILMNKYVDNNHLNPDWSVQLQARASANTMLSIEDNVTVPLIEDAWVEIRCEIDLDANTVAIYYNGSLMTTHVWFVTGGQAQIQAVDLYSDNVSSLAYYDNLSLEPATSTETLVPTAFSVGTSKLQSGTLASLAADDNDPLVVCKFLVPNFNDIIKVSFDFQTTKANITAIDLVTKAKMVQGGVFKVRPFLHNYSTNADDVIAADTAITAVYAVFTFPASGTLNNYKDATKKMNAKILVRQLGPSVAVIPCVSYEYVNLKVTG